MSHSDQPWLKSVWEEKSDQLSVSSLTSLSSLKPTSKDIFDTNITDFRAKVDRKLLEKMLDGSDSSVESANDFFARASNESGAIISFPQIWKLQIMERKDPEIRIIGTSTQVRCAQKLIMDVLDPHRNRVVIKIDVSFGDHSYIIGKGGKRIQSIMSLTQTQIHFPDENLFNLEIKSNMVTITSDSLQRADEARQLIRQSLPLTVGFQLQIGVDKACLLDNRHPIIEYYQRRYNVIITFKSIESTDMDIITVNVQLRGSRLHFEQLREAARAMYSLLFSSPIGFNSKVVTITIEISPRHHSFVLGANNANFRSICNRTGAIISFPDTDTSNSSLIQSSQSNTVTIKGRGIESAFMAWLELLDCLPVVLIFDMRAEQIDYQLLTSLMTNKLLTIKILPKVNSEKRSIILKTQERHTTLLFGARRQILKLKEEPKSVSMGPSHMLSIWDQSSGQFTGLPYIPQDVIDSEPEVIRSNGKLFQKF